VNPAKSQTKHYVKQVDRGSHTGSERRNDVKQKIVTHLWFPEKADEAAAFYASKVATSVVLESEQTAAAIG